jgi:hypothetical protein
VGIVVWSRIWTAILQKRKRFDIRERRIMAGGKVPALTLSFWRTSKSVLFRSIRRKFSCELFLAPTYDHDRTEYIWSTPLDRSETMRLDTRRYPRSFLTNTTRFLRRRRRAARRRDSWGVLPLNMSDGRLLGSKCRRLDVRRLSNKPGIRTFLLPWLIAIFHLLII